MLLIQNGGEGHAADDKTSRIYLPETHRQQIEDYGFPTTGGLHSYKIFPIEETIDGEHL